MNYNDTQANNDIEKNPLVSVIIPNYNHARFLDERIQSVLNQTYQNFEVIILDDKSTDNSVEVINKYKDNPHVSHIVINEENTGSSFAQWHRGILLSSGDVVWIAESDDSCDENLLYRLVDVYKKSGCVIAFCRSSVIDEKGKRTEYPKQRMLNADFTMDGKDFIRRYMIHENIIANASSAIFDRQTALQIDSQYQKMKGEGDYLFWIEMAERGRVAYVAVPYNYFRHHSLNTTSALCNNGVNSCEHKIVLEYIKSIKLISTFEFIVLKAFIIYYLSKTAFINNEVKDKVMSTWDSTLLYRILTTPIVSAYLKIRTNVG